MTGRQGCDDIYAGPSEGAPGDPEAQINAFADHYNHQRYYEAIGNLTPADVYFGRGQTILLEREKIKRQTIQHRRLNHRTIAAWHQSADAPDPLFQLDPNHIFLSDDGHGEAMRLAAETLK
jgi:hypothetical protein